MANKRGHGDQYEDDLQNDPNG